jgi:hypothetical protein
MMEPAAEESFPPSEETRGFSVEKIPRLDREELDCWNRELAWKW